MLGVEVNIFHIFCADGLESSKANVEGDGLDLYSLLFQLVENFCREVQAGSGGGGRARFMREDCLVAVAVLWAVLSMDVRREGHVTYFVDDSGKIWSGGKSQGTFAEVFGGEDFGFKDTELHGPVLAARREVLAGLLCLLLRDIEQGSRIEADGVQYEVIGMDGRRVDRVLITPPTKASER